MEEGIAFPGHGQEECDVDRLYRHDRKPSRRGGDKETQRGLLSSISSMLRSKTRETQPSGYATSRGDLLQRFWATRDKQKLQWYLRHELWSRSPGVQYFQIQAQSFGGFEFQYFLFVSSTIGVLTPTAQPWLLLAGDQVMTGHRKFPWFLNQVAGLLIFGV